jgi:hypothetical protein
MESGTEWIQSSSACLSSLTFSCFLMKWWTKKNDWRYSVDGVWAIYVRCRASTVLCCYDTLCWLLSVTAGTTRTQRGTHIYFRDFPQKHKNNGLDVISSSDTGYCKKWDVSDATGHSCNRKCATPFDLRGQSLNLQKLTAYCVLWASNYENNERRGNVSVYDVTLFSTSGQREVAWWDL